MASIFSKPHIPECQEHLCIRLPSVCTFEINITACWAVLSALPNCRTLMRLYFQKIVPFCSILLLYSFCLAIFFLGTTFHADARNLLNAGTSMYPRQYTAIIASPGFESWVIANKKASLP